jgi:hypothetical protein
VPARRLSALVRHYARLVAFSLPVRRLLERPTSAPPGLRVALDHASSNATPTTGLGATIARDQTAATVANLIRYVCREHTVHVLKRDTEAFGDHRAKATRAFTGGRTAMYLTSGWTARHSRAADAEVNGDPVASAQKPTRI